MEKHIMGENGISYTLGRGTVCIICDLVLHPGRDRVSDWESYGMLRKLG
ncbi:MAG: hypothetical protein ACLTTJ_03240 [Blautia sp.]